jgi:transposase-like protein
MPTVQANCSCGYQGPVHYEEPFGKPKCPKCGRELNPWSGTPVLRSLTKTIVQFATKIGGLWPHKKWPYKQA